MDKSELYARLYGQNRTKIGGKIIDENYVEGLQTLL